MDQKRIENIVRDFLLAIGEDIEREGLKSTPSIISRLSTKLFKGIGKDPSKALKKYKVSNEDGMIVIKDIPFYSLCEHHLLPFFGKVHLVYIPNGEITGFGEIAEFIEILSRRLQLQERLTHQIADIFKETLNPKGVLVVVEAEHLCITIGESKMPGSYIVTSATHGILKEESTKAEALTLIKGARF